MLSSWRRNQERRLRLRRWGRSRVRSRDGSGGVVRECSRGPFYAFLFGLLNRGYLVLDYARVHIV